MLSKYLKMVNILGSLLMLLSAVTFIPLIVVLSYLEKGTALSFGITAVVLAALGTAFYIPTKKYRGVKFSKGDSALVVFLMWIFAVFLCVPPFMTDGGLDFSQAVFESTSAWTTTGFTVINAENTPNSLLFYRSFIQYVGGIGIVLILLFILPPSSSTSLYNAELHTDKILPNIKKTIKSILIIYISYLVIGSIALWISGMSFFDAVNHTMAALATGGFSTKNNSIGYYNNPAIEGVLIVLMIAGSINFAVQFLLFTGKFRRFLSTSEFKFLPLLILIAFPLLAYGGLLSVYGDAGYASRVAIFELVSAFSTTGFTMTSYSNWPAFAIYIIIALMIIGGHTGSTAGGVKHVRIVIALKSFYWQITKHFKPERQVENYYINTYSGKYYLTDKNISWNNTFILLYLFVVFLGALIISAFGYDLRSSLFESASLLGNVGISIGIITPSVHPFILWLGSVMMLLGRLEFLVAFIGLNQIYKDISYRIRFMLMKKKEREENSSSEKISSKLKIKLPSNIIR